MLTSTEVIKDLEAQFRDNKILGVKVYTIDNCKLQFMEGFRVVFNPISKDIEFIYGMGYNGGEQLIVPYHSILKIEPVHTSKTEPLI